MEVSLYKRERLGFFIRTIWALLQHFAVGHIAQCIANVPVDRATEVKTRMSKLE